MFVLLCLFYLWRMYTVGILLVESQFFFLVTLDSIVYCCPFQNLCWFWSFCIKNMFISINTNGCHSGFSYFIWCELSKIQISEISMIYVFFFNFHRWKYRTKKNIKKLFFFHVHHVRVGSKFNAFQFFQIFPKYRNAMLCTLFMNNESTSILYS